MPSVVLRFESEIVFLQFLSKVCPLDGVEIPPQGSLDSTREWNFLKGIFTRFSTPSGIFQLAVEFPLNVDFHAKCGWLCIYFVDIHEYFVYT